MNREKSRLDAELDFRAEVHQLGENLREARECVERLHQHVAPTGAEEIPELVEQCHALLATGYEFKERLDMLHPLPWKKLYNVGPLLDETWTWIALTSDGELVHARAMGPPMVIGFFLGLAPAFAMTLSGLLGAQVDWVVTLTFALFGLLTWGVAGILAVRPYRPTLEVPAERMVRSLQYHVRDGLSWARKEQERLQREKQELLGRMEVSAEIHQGGRG